MTSLQSGPPSPILAPLFELLDDGTGGYLPDGTPLIGNVIALYQSLMGITVASEDPIEQARGVVLVVKP